MSDYITRYEGALLTHISTEMETKTEHMVINTQMPDQLVHWNRGYIACLRNLGVFIQNDLRKKLNEVPK